MDLSQLTPICYFVHLLDKNIIFSHILIDNYQAVFQRVYRHFYFFLVLRQNDFITEKITNCHSFVQYKIKKFSLLINLLNRMISDHRRTEDLCKPHLHHLFYHYTVFVF